jgi:uncharacterized membrane protein YkoI
MKMKKVTPVIALVFACMYAFPLPAVSADVCMVEAAAPVAGLIGEAKAKEIAFSHAGILPEMARKLKCELDTENGRLVYDIEFEAGLHEYEYENDATTGAIIKSKKELD